MTVREVSGSGFDHLVVERAGSSVGTRLHVYIEGDGTPWARNAPSADPTPRNPLALRLAGQDPNDSVYVGRPCYFRAAVDTATCRPALWTSQRYGEEVVRSMAAAIERARLPRHAEIILIGYSGGGVLAALLESRVDGVVGVITIAANLDTTAWTRVRGFSPLEGSLNPMNERRDPRIPHLQLIGMRDDTVPPISAVEYARLQPNVELIRFPEFGHVCCWEADWTTVLAGLLSRFDD